jgi:hypothetical protein
MTTAILFIFVAVLAALVMLLLGSQVEMYRDLAQTREYVGMVDRSIPVDLGATVGARPSEVGLPDHLDSAVSALVLFLSDKCATCRSIAESLDGVIPRGVQLVIEPGSAPPGAVLADTLGFPEDRVVIDHGRKITDRIGIEVTPVGIIVEHGRLVSATTLPSTRQFFALLENRRTIRVGERAEAQQVQADQAQADLVVGSNQHASH